MSSSRTGLRKVLAVSAAVAAVGALAACGSSGGGTSGGPSGASAGRVNLVLNDFGTFGYAPLIKQYETAHPNIHVTENVGELNQHHTNLSTHLATGSGAGDIEAIDESFINQFKAQPQNFVNLLDRGAGSLKSRWVDWKWAQSLTGDGKTQVGLGTDAGGLAMCYRTDLFAKAGLPTDRNAVAKLWPTWKDYINVGKTFEAKKVGAHWFDAGTNLYNAQMFQATQSYYTNNNNLIVDSNPQVRQAWDNTVAAIQAGESAGLVSFQADWTTAMTKGTFATLACPAWMQGYIQTNAPGTRGKWDIATVPEGKGNWGGSFLTIPKQSKHQKEAYDLISFLTDPKQQTSVFTSIGNLPSTKAALADPKVTSFINPFFNNAPTGQIFAASATKLQPQYLGPKTGEIRVAMEQGIQRVEQHRQSPDAAWSRSVRDAKRAAGQ